MQTNLEIYRMIDEIAPFSTQMSFDNAGFLVGEQHAKVDRVLVALDATLEVVQEGIDKQCQLIITHHPLIFNPLKAVTNQDTIGKIVLKLIQNNIALISAHTNLDRSQDGVNHHLARVLQLKNQSILQEEGVDPYGRVYGIGMMGEPHAEGLMPREYADYVAKKLNGKGVRFTDTGAPVKRVAVGGGSCGSMLEWVEQCGCDTFVTGDVKYDVFLEARARGINLLDAGHYATEQVVCAPLADMLSQRAPEVTFLLSSTHKEVYDYLQGGQTD